MTGDAESEECRAEIHSYMIRTIVNHPLPAPLLLYFTRVTKLLVLWLQWLRVFLAHNIILLIPIINFIRPNTKMRFIKEIPDFYADSITFQLIVNGEEWCSSLGHSLISSSYHIIFYRMDLFLANKREIRVLAFIRSTDVDDDDVQINSQGNIIIPGDQLIAWHIEVCPER